ncbi:MAG: ABC transporter permease [Alphaproteobacteria bacterium]|nr:ABC transporter permease [Alphaproteobacteria bacterium]
MGTSIRLLTVFLGLMAIWQVVVWITGVPHFILPPPWTVAVTLVEKAGLLAYHTSVTGTEIVLGLLIGVGFGLWTAIVMTWARPLRVWLMPVLIASQAVPVFALAPLLVLWLGYGIASKVAMAALILFFPVTAAFLEGLTRADRALLDAGRTLGVKGAALLWRIRVPAALPALASGLKVATAVAPIGAVVGEWVGSSAGLGFLMLHANGRMQTDLVFAAVVVLAVLAVSLYALVSLALNRLLHWAPETTSPAPS